MKTLLIDNINPQDYSNSSQWLFTQVQALQAVGCTSGLPSVLMTLVNELDSLVQMSHTTEINLIQAA